MPRERTPNEMRLETLGFPRLRRIGGDADDSGVLEASKPLALLVYLAMAARPGTTRDSLCDLLWGDKGIDEARALLRQALWTLRRRVPGIDLRATKDVLTLVSTVTLDVREFTEAFDAKEPARALALYGGDFFEGYEAIGGTRFNLWVHSERVRLRAMACGCAQLLARSAIDSGTPADAIQWARRWQQLDPESQQPWCLLIEAAAAMGDTLRARAFSSECQAWLSGESVEPSPELLSALRMARRPAESTVADGTNELRAEFLGREAEFSALHRAWVATTRMGVHHVHIESENGFGRTRLVDEFAAHLRAQGARVLAVRSHISERGVAFASCARIATALSSRPGARGIASGSASVLLALNPALSNSFAGEPSAGPLDARSAGLALSDLLYAVSDDDPFALLLDDVQWMDPESLDALSMTGGTTGKLRLLLVTAARASYPVGVQAEEGSRLRLAAFTPAEVRSLVGSLASLPDSTWTAEFVRELHEAAGGSPAVVIELLRACVDEQFLAIRGGVWHCNATDDVAHFLGGVARRRLFLSLTPLERRILTVLQVAHESLSSTVVARACEHERSAVSTPLLQLEERGLIRTNGEAVTLAAHTLARTVVSDDSEVRTVHRSLGDALRARGLPADRRKALAHLVAGEDWISAGPIAARLLRADGLRRPSDHDVRLLLGPDVPPETVQRVHRLARGSASRRSWQIAGSLVGLLLMVALGVATLRGGPLDTGVRLAVGIPDAGGRWRGGTILLNRRDWDISTPLDVKATSRWSVFLPFIAAHQAPRPGFDAWAEHRVSPDSGEGDIVLVERGRGERRLTYDPGQDRPGTFSPDGRTLVISSTRWSTHGRSALALLDLESSKVTRLTRSEGTDEAGIWHPDGTGIAFSRYLMEEDRLQLCIASIDGLGESCRDCNGWTGLQLLGWTGGDAILAAVDSEGVRTIRRVDQRGESRIIDGLGDAEMRVDPTGEWVLMLLPRTGGRSTLWIAPADAMTERRAVRVDGGTEYTEAQFVLDHVRARYVDTLALVAPVQRLERGVPYQIGARMVRATGEPAEGQRIQWRAQGSGARIDALGVLSAADTGHVDLEASLGGWRIARLTLPVIEGTNRVVFTEDWSGDVFDRWRPYGDPLPTVVVESRGSRALSTNGDGRFYSGAYLRDGVDAVAGVALDAELSTPITSPQWQVLILSLEGVGDSAIPEWDHRTGYPNLGTTWNCSMMYPNGEGPRALREMGPIYQLADALGGDVSTLADGRTWRLRLQLFPDGRCGVAVNGLPLYIVPGSGRVASFSQVRAVRPVIKGASVGTQILVRNVRLVSGVPRDIEWARLLPQDGIWRARRREGSQRP